MSKTVMSKVGGYTPVVDSIIQKHGLITAAVFGRAWRYCQMTDGICKASLGTIAKRLNLSSKTISRSIQILCNDGYMTDLTPDIIGKPHTYADTGKAELKINISFGDDEDDNEPGTQSPGSKSTDSESVVNAKSADSESVKDRGIKEIYSGEKKISPNRPFPSITYPVQEESVILTGKKDNLIKDPRIGAYRGLAHLTPNQVQREEICNRVTDLELWQATVTGWLGHGWNPKNITGMLEVYEKGGLDKSGRNNDHKTTINPGTDREVNSNYPTGVTKSDGVPGLNETYYDR